MLRQTTQQLITALYPRLSHDDEKSKGRKAKLFFSASIGDAADCRQSTIFMTAFLI